MTSIKPRIAAENLTPGIALNGPLDQAIAKFAAAVVKANKVDPIISELVRLRCAQIHDCRLCGSLRHQDALEQGFDEVMQHKIARYQSSDFSPKMKTALRLCDAMILSPASADATLKADLDEYFSPEQIAEICFDIVKWSQQKALVALRMEAPREENLSVLFFDEQGNPKFGGPAYG